MYGLFPTSLMDWIAPSNKEHPAANRGGLYPACGALQVHIAPTKPDAQRGDRLYSLAPPGLHGEAVDQLRVSDVAGSRRRKARLTASLMCGGAGFRVLRAYASRLPWKRQRS